MNNLQQTLERNPLKMSGAVVFRGTRVPVETFLEWIRNGETVEFFLENFPSVTRSQVDDLLTNLLQDCLDRVPTSEAVLS